MAFLDKEEVMQLSEKDKNEFWITAYQKGEAATMFMAGFFAFVILVFFTMSIEFPPDWWFFMWLVRIVLFVVFGFAITVLLALEKGAMIKFIEAIGTDTIKDDIKYGIYTFLCLLAFGSLDYYGGGKFLNYVNKYEPKVIKDHNSDLRISDNSKSKNTYIEERDKRLTELKCSECISIIGAYALKIANKEKGRRVAKTDADANWVNGINRKIDADIGFLKSEREGKTIEANSRFEQKKDSISNSYNAKINRADTMNLGLKASIDSNNVVEIIKGEENEKSNKKWGGILSPVIIIMLCWFRWELVSYCRKSNMEWAAVGEFLKGTNNVAVILTPMQIWFSEKMEMLNIDNSARLGNAIERIEDYKTASTKSDFSGKLIDRGITDLETAKRLKKLDAFVIENNSKIIDEIVENVAETPVNLNEINDIINGYEILLTVCEPSEYSEINDIVESYKILLSTL